MICRNSWFCQHFLTFFIGYKRYKFIGINESILKNAFDYPEFCAWKSLVLLSKENIENAVGKTYVANHLRKMELCLVYKNVNKRLYQMGQRQEWVHLRLTEPQI